MRTGQAVIGFLAPLIDPATAQGARRRRASRRSASTRSRGRCRRAQTMDALSSQANVGGYKAVLIAANAFGRYFPLLTTAAGTAKPANVLILGIGVAGLQAIGTARRLGAVVKAYDVRPETTRAGREPRRPVRQAQDDDRRDRRRRLRPRADAPRSGPPSRPSSTRSSAAMDVVITTAQVPGRKPPVLVTADAVGRMKPGSVIVDMAASRARRQLRAEQGRRDGQSPTTA